MRNALNKSTLTFGKISQIPLQINYSWFLMSALLILMLALGYYPSQFAGWEPVQYWLFSVVTISLLFVSLLLHELAHALAAQHDHLPVRDITFDLSGGVVRIESLPTNARSEFQIAAAGPLVNIFLTLTFTIAANILSGLPHISILFLGMLRLLAIINGAIAIFNLIPVLPMDGGRMLLAVLWGTTHSVKLANQLASMQGRFVAYIFIVFGVIQTLGGNTIYGLWVVFIGLFLDSVAATQLHCQNIQGLLSGPKVHQSTSQELAVIPADMPLLSLVDEYIFDRGEYTFVIRQGDVWVGLASLNQISSVPLEEWRTTKLGQIMIPKAELEQYQPGLALWKVLEEIGPDGVDHLPVVLNEEIKELLDKRYC